MSRLATRPARASGEFAIGGDLRIVRLGYGSMQIPGPGVWGRAVVAHQENAGAALIELTPDQVRQLDAAI